MNSPARVYVFELDGEERAMYAETEELARSGFEKIFNREPGELVKVSEIEEYHG